MSDLILTRAQVEKALPPTVRSVVTDQFVDQINNAIQDPIVADQMKANFLSYSSVLRDGKYKMQDYLHAVMYVSFKLMNLSNTDAYARTFPKRHAELLAKGTSPKDMSAYVSAYARNKLVNEILAQAVVPTWVLNQDKFQEAINIQIGLARNAVSEKVRSDAANSILTHLARPKDTLNPIPVDIQEGSGMAALKDALAKLVTGQLNELAAGSVTTKDVASQRIIVQEDGNE